MMSFTCLCVFESVYIDSIGGNGGAQCCSNADCTYFSVFKNRKHSRPGLISAQAFKASVQTSQQFVRRTTPNLSAYPPPLCSQMFWVSYHAITPVNFKSSLETGNTPSLLVTGSSAAAFLTLCNKSDTLLPKLLTFFVLRRLLMSTTATIASNTNPKVIAGIRLCRTTGDE